MYSSILSVPPHYSNGPINVSATSVPNSVMNSPVPKLAPRNSFFSQLKSNEALSFQKDTPASSAISDLWTINDGDESDDYADELTPVYITPLPSLSFSALLSAYSRI